MYTEGEPRGAGHLTALMGGSGAGKTTFMDTIAGRKTTGRIEGRIGVNGFPMQQASWSRTLAYVEQSDVHSPQLTVLESLLVSSALRLPRGTSEGARMNHVSATLAMVRTALRLLPSACESYGWDPHHGTACCLCERCQVSLSSACGPCLRDLCHGSHCTSLYCAV